MSKLKSLFLLDRQAYEDLYGAGISAEINALTEPVAPPQTKQTIEQNPEILREVEVIFSGWGMPVVNDRFLDLAPQLKAIFYGAGSIRNFATESLWKRNIIVTSSAAMNAIPVSEFTLAQILLSLKRTWEYALRIREQGLAGKVRDLKVPGAYKSKVGLISLGEIGRLVRQRLKPFDLDVYAYDPFLSQEQFRALDVKPLSLEELFQQCDVVSLHTPLLPSTVGMITGNHFRMMKPNATFINTSRGAIIREREMIDVLQERTDIWALLDVLDNNDQGVDPIIYRLPNVIITPHIAGAMDKECQRLGQAALDEFKRYLHGEPLGYIVTPEKFALMA